MFTLHKTGKVCIAMLCAFSAIGGSACGGFVGSVAITVLAADTDVYQAHRMGDRMTLDQYERLFGLDLTNPANALLDYDGDGLLNWEEANKGTDPLRADTDEDGWPDGIDNEISRARLDFNPLFIAGNSFSYFWPSWMVAAFFKAGGEWETSLPAWYLPAGASGKLCLILDRSVLTNDVVLELEFYDAPNASLFVDVVNINEEVIISSELVGNPSTLLRAGLVDGSEEIVRKAINIPLETYPDAVGIHLRGTGELFLFEVLIFVDRDNDGLDENQEAILGTSDLMLDTDGDGISDYQEVFVYGTNPAKRGTSPTAETIFTGRANRPWPTAASERRGLGEPEQSSNNMLSSPVKGGTKQEFRAAKIKAITIPQFVRALMSDGNFVMSRDTLSGGGTRQTSPAFSMEDSLGQSSAIGFSFGSLITLHAGYQQAEAERLEIWNVSVTPTPYQQQLRRFNPTLGETATFSYVFSTPVRAATVAVYDQNGMLVQTLLAQQPQNGGLHTVAWDGRNDAGSFVQSNRKYTNTLSAMSYDGAVTNYQPANINEVRMEVVENIPVIKLVADWPDPFFPDIVVTSTISYVTAAPAGVTALNLTIEIYADNLSGLPVRTWATNQPVGANAVIWDGTGNNGMPLPDGLYTYAINHAAPPATRANRQTGAIMLLRTNTQEATNADVVVRYSGPSTVSITSASPVETSSALFAIKTADPGQMLESMIYRIEATPPTTFVPPALMAFKYDQEKISGDIEQKLQIRRFNETNRVWEIVPVQFIDYANHQVLAEITSFSLYALLTGEDTTPPVIQIISPEAREYYLGKIIDILYEAEDPVVGGVSSGVAEVFVYLNGELYTDTSIPPSAFMLGENILTVAASDGAGNIGRATVCFTVILQAQVTLKPEALNVNPGILTAFVRLPEDYPVAGITSAACDGALYERMMLSDDGTEMIIKFRRQDIETALARTGESIDIYFIVRGDWQDSAGNSYIFQGTDSITKIVGAR